MAFMSSLRFGLVTFAKTKVTRPPAAMSGLVIEKKTNDEIKP
jgi:hypothetical protein